MWLPLEVPKQLSECLWMFSSPSSADKVSRIVWKDCLETAANEKGWFCCFVPNS